MPLRRRLCFALASSRVAWSTPVPKQRGLLSRQALYLRCDGRERASREQAGGFGPESGGAGPARAERRAPLRLRANPGVDGALRPAHPLLHGVVLRLPVPALHVRLPPARRRCPPLRIRLASAVGLRIDGRLRVADRALVQPLVKRHQVGDGRVAPPGLARRHARLPGAALPCVLPCPACCGVCRRSTRRELPAMHSCVKTSGSGAAAAGHDDSGAVAWRRWRTCSFHMR